MNGGFHDPRSLPSDLLDEYARVGARAGYSRAARRLLEALPSFVAARARYRRITAPVTLVRGDKDWATLRDRAGVEAALPSPEVVTLERTGRFSALERSQVWADIILARTAKPKLTAAKPHGPPSRPAPHPLPRRSEDRHPCPNR